jgi:folate-binding protein YgfZ
VHDVNRNLLYNLHEASGAMLRPVDEPLPVLAYGDVPGEYEAATQGAVIFDETERGLVQVSGSDAMDFLQRLLANEVLPVEVGSGNRNLLLTGKGKVRFDFDLERTDDGFRLSTPPGGAAGLLQGLDMYLFDEDVKLTDASESYAPMLLSGPESTGLLEGLFEELPGEDHQTTTVDLDGERVRVTRVAPYGGSSSYRLEGGPEIAQALWTTIVARGARPSGRIVSDILRVEAIRGLWGEDIGEDVYPQEARLEEAFNLSKGCYIGQEVVAKIDTYGGINKKLCALGVSHNDPVPAGTRLMRFDEERDEWRDLGVVTSWAYSFKQDSGQVLGYVKRRHQDPGTIFRLGEGPGEATLIE